jgi:hypothetical protein
VESRWRRAARAAGERVRRGLRALDPAPPADADRAGEDPGAQLDRAVSVILVLGFLLAVLHFLGQFF